MGLFDGKATWIFLEGCLEGETGCLGYCFGAHGLHGLAQKFHRFFGAHRLRGLAQKFHRF
ncbi:MAG TPA: hypothetical protein PKD18_19045 [Saprospiraceae bacterium]|nr:hypothetical protein [Saprospiraceae bacterium]